MTWLHRIWMSPAEHERIVEELQSKINRLEEDYVSVSQSLVGEIQARRNAERVRDFMQATTARPASLPSGRVIPFDKHDSKKSPVLTGALKSDKV